MFPCSYPRTILIKKSEYPEGYSDGPNEIIRLEALRKENQIEAQRSGFDLERSRDRMNERRLGPSGIIGLGKIQSYQWFASCQQEVLSISISSVFVAWAFLFSYTRLYSLLLFCQQDEQLLCNGQILISEKAGGLSLPRISKPIQEKRVMNSSTKQWRFQYAETIPI